MAHLYASFADASLAEKAAGALLDYGVRQEDISLVANDAHGAARTTQGVAGAAAGAGRGAGNVGDSAIDATQAVGHGLAQAGDRVAGAVTGAVGATGTAAGFEAAGDQHAAGAEGRATMAGHEAAVHGSAADAGRSAGVYDSPAVAGDLNPLDQGGPDSPAHNDTNLAAKHGISTTTPEDAGQGAVKGTGIGLGVGILASLAALMVPGVGLVLGGGALAAALGGTALAAGAGAIAGGVTGYLKEQGVPGEAAERYHGAIEQGGAVLSVSLPSGQVDQATAEQVLSKYGAADVGAY